MDTDPSIPPLGTTKSSPAAGSSRRGLAIAEVVLAFVFVHVAFRAIKNFTVLGRLDVASRLNFMPGLLVSSVLFGFLHALNSVDYFHGRLTFAWGFGVAALGTGLLFGFLREGTGSIVAGVVTHSVLDVLARIPTLIP